MPVFPASCEVNVTLRLSGVQTGPKLTPSKVRRVRVPRSNSQIQMSLFLEPPLAILAATRSPSGDRRTVVYPCAGRVEACALPLRSNHLRVGFSRCCPTGRYTRRPESEKE